MIRIPFDRCVILSTLTLPQITDRLESAIYVGATPSLDRQLFLSLIATNNIPKHQRYFGLIRGFKFLATPIIRSEYLHLPIFLSPTIEGDINSLPYGYEISLGVKLNNLICTLLLTWLGGLLTTISSVLDNILLNSKNYQYLTTVPITAFFYAIVIAYFYFSAWQSTKFFKTLFAQGFAGTTQLEFVNQSASNLDLQFQDVENLESSTDWLRKHLPSFPSPLPPDPVENLESSTDWLRKNLPSFPSPADPQTSKLNQSECDE
jgi:hypothetical protein